MEEIKSVRVRTSESNDIKVTIYKSGNKRKVSGYSSINTLGDSEYGGNRYRDLSDDEIIQDFLSVVAKRENKPLDFYKIVQNPWMENPPMWRSYGSDPYYLNNGTKVFINWLDDDLINAGGKEWSDESGNELDIKRGLTSSTKGLITKTVTIRPPSGSGDNALIIKDSSISDLFETGQKFSGNTVDLSIITQVISYWKKKIPDYEIDLCSPNNEFCNIIGYKSPVNELVPDEPDPIPTEESTQDQNKIKLSVVLPEELSLRVKEDFNGLKVYIGDPPPPGGFIFQDDFDNLNELDPEFMESDFSGDEELIFKEPDEEFRNEIDKAGEDSESDISSSGDSISFDHSSKSFLSPDVNKSYSSIYKLYIDHTKMPNPKLTKKSLIDVKLKVEGGLTGDPNDSAAKKGYCPTPKGGKKYHTNKGVTYVVWKTVFGSGNDSRFLTMSHQDWEKVFDRLYWDKHGKSSKYESVNALLTSFAWGGSKGPTVDNAKKILGVTNLDVVSEGEAVAALISARAQLFINISKPGTKNNTFRKGWINAINAFTKTTYSSPSSSIT